MFYKFPIIEHLDQVREAIAGRDEFIVAEREWGFVANYLVCYEDTFPEPTTKDDKLNEHYCLRRECRGLIFDKYTSKVISRGFHKFHNVNERPSTEMHKIDLSIPHIILDKLDGSFIRPFQGSDGVFRVGTKMGETDIAALAKPFFDKPEYRNIAEWCIENNMTPIFEFLSKKQQIVIRYEEERLVLLAIRHNITGEYIKY